MANLKYLIELTTLLYITSYCLAFLHHVPTTTSRLLPVLSQQQDDPKSLHTTTMNTGKIQAYRSYKKYPTNTALYMALTPAERHYASKQWFYCVKTWPKSRILRRIHHQLFSIAAWSAILNIFQMVTKIKIAFPFFIHTIAGSALSLLLVFKTNTSYDRFWEGRKMWGAIVGTCRSFTRMSYVHIDKEDHQEIAILLMVFCIMLRQHLRSESKSSEFAEYVGEQDIDYLLGHRHGPIIVLRRLEQRIFELISLKYNHTNPLFVNSLITDFRLYLNTLTSSMGSCERIVKTPAPYFYSINTSRFLSLYLFTLPFAIIPFLGWNTIPTILALSWCFISIQEIGHFIEDPFNSDIQIIAMSEITNVIRSDMSDILDGVLSPSALSKKDKDGNLLFKLQEESKIVSTGSSTATTLDVTR